MQQQNQDLAYLPIVEPEALAECLVAMANADGGTIVLGVGEDGKTTSQIWDEEAEGLLRAALSHVKPFVQSVWQPSSAPNGDSVIALKVLKSADLHTMSDGRVLVRRGVNNEAVTGRDLALLTNSRTVAEFEMETVPGARRSDLSDAVVQEYIELRDRRGASVTTAIDPFLFEIGATDREGNPTVMGILLFCERPQIFLPQSRVDFIRFDGIEARGADGGPGYGRRDEISGPLAHVIKKAFDIVRSEMQAGTRINGVVREQLTDYPSIAVREAIVNAVCHRDYRMRGRRIEIRMYADRMEIISPGGLAGHMTLDNLVEEHYSRNPRIVNGLFYWSYIEELGLGIDHIFDSMLQAGNPPPMFDATPHRFMVKLEKSKRGKLPIPKWSRNMNERQEIALAYVKEHGGITNREYQRLVDNASAETLRRDLADLVKKGVLLKIGSKKGTHYILKQ